MKDRRTWSSFFLRGLDAPLHLGPYIGYIENVDLTTTKIPNQGTLQSAKNAIKISLISGLLGSLLFSLTMVVVGGPVSGAPINLPIVVLVVGLGCGMFPMLIYGGNTVIDHYSLRFLLYLNGDIPWNYVRFLDYCAERIFLRRVGGGYIFVHRLLMEHFAAMYKE